MSTPTTTERTEQLTQELLERQREYHEEVREAAEHGLRVHYCIHGTDRWTDYDNICPGCEDGLFTEHSTYAEVVEWARIIADEEAVRRDQQYRLVTNHVQSVVEAYRVSNPHTGAARVYRDGVDAVLVLPVDGQLLAAEFTPNGVVWMKYVN